MSEGAGPQPENLVACHGLPAEAESVQLTPTALLTVSACGYRDGSPDALPLVGSTATF